MKDKNNRFSQKINIQNRKARFNYELLEKLETGIVLKGTEIKSIREGKVSLQEAHCFIHKNEIFIKGMTISPYEMASFSNHEINRERKLLIKKRELEKLKSKSEEKGLAIIPTKLYTNDRGKAKVEIALARGKKLFDKRDTLKMKDQKREVERIKI